MENITKQVIPIGAALALGWTLAQVGFKAGATVSSSETAIASLSARVDGIVKAADKAATDAREDHDKLTMLIGQNENLQREFTALDSRLQSQARSK
jgi:hypothetical protein